MEKVTTFGFSCDPLSNSWQTKFTWNGKLWTSVEQAFQYRKAEVFGDQYAMELIRNTADCKQQKRITRNLVNFDQKLWDKMRESVMKSICREKFQQIESARRLLIASKGTILAEANPWDVFWATGLSANDPLMQDSPLWPGKNMDGSILMEIRDEIFESEEFQDEIVQIENDVLCKALKKAL